MKPFKVISLIAGAGILAAVLVFAGSIFDWRATSQGPAVSQTTLQPVAVAPMGGQSMATQQSMIKGATNQGAVNQGAINRSAVLQLAGFQVAKLKLSNMGCASCPFIVRRTLEDADGVVKAEVSYRDQTAIVTYDASKSSATQLAAIVSGLGFPTTVIK